MVQQTFKNLPKERQNLILQIAYEEFAINGYQNASLSAIIKNIGVAKGSFYRYFSSKRDLFAYLLEKGLTRRYKDLDEIIKKGDISFFELIKLNFKAIIMSDKENPLVSGFFYQVVHERGNSGEVSDIIETLYKQVIERIKDLLEDDEYQREIKNIDTDFVAFHVFYSQLWFYDYVAFKHRIDYEENIRNHRPVLNLPDEELNQIIDMSVELLKYGLKEQPDRVC